MKSLCVVFESKGTLVFSQENCESVAEIARRNGGEALRLVGCHEMGDLGFVPRRHFFTGAIPDSLYGMQMHLEASAELHAPQRSFRTASYPMHLVADDMRDILQANGISLEGTGCVLVIEAIPQ